MFLALMQKLLYKEIKSPQRDFFSFFMNNCIKEKKLSNTTITHNAIVKPSGRFFLPLHTSPNFVNITTYIKIVDRRISAKLIMQGANFSLLDL